MMDYVDYDLYRLGSREFEHMTQALTVAVLGSRVQVFGDGPDGGREAAFEGDFPHPSRESGRAWAGYGVLQAKFHQVAGDVAANTTWLKDQLRSELEKWSDPSSRRVQNGRIPEYLLIATNVRLSSVPQVGGVDSVSQLVDAHAKQLGLKDWDLWHYDKIRSLLDDHPGIRRAYAHLITPGDVLVRMHEQISHLSPDFGDVITGQVAKEMTRDQWVRLSEAGQSENQRLALGKVAIDLPAHITRDDVEPQTVYACSHVIDCANAVLRPSHNIEVPRGIVIVGGPGQGKTTIGQLLCQTYRAALIIGKPEQELTGEVVRLRDKFLTDVERIGLSVPTARRWPARVRLSSYTDDLSREPELSLLGYIARMMQPYAHAVLSPGVLLNWLKAWPWFVVLDGLDEVADQRAREELLRKVSDLAIDAAQAGGDMFIVVTTRPQGYMEEAPLGGYPHLRLRPLRVDEAINYAERLTNERYRDDSDFAHEIRDRLRRAAMKAETSYLMQTPLQVTIMSLLLERRPHAPRGQYELFQGYYATIFDREAAKNTREAYFLNSNRSHVQVLHEWTGLVLQKRSEREGGAGAALTADEVRNLACRRLLSEGYSNGSAANLADELIDVVEKRLVLLRRSDDRFSFEVRSLQEFMAARALASGKDDEVLARFSALTASTHWRHTLLLAADRVFTEREGLRGDVLHQVKAADFTDLLSMRILPGARLAVDLLEDGVAHSSPVHERALVMHALDLLHALPDRSTPRLAEVLRRAAEPGNFVDTAITETAAAGGTASLTALLILACWADMDAATAATAKARLRTVKVGMTPNDKLLAATLAADYPLRGLRDLAPLSAGSHAVSTLGEALRRHVMSAETEKLGSILTALDSARTWRECRGDLTVCRVDRSTLPELTQLDQPLAGMSAVDALLDVGSRLPASDWPQVSELYRILGAWLQRRPVGDRISHPVIDL